MHKIIILIFLLILNSNYGYSQDNYEIIYKSTFFSKNYDSLIKNNNDGRKRLIYQTLNRDLNNAKAISKKIDFVLKVNNNRSIFFMKPVLSLKEKDLRMAKLMLKFKGLYYTERNKILNKKNSYGEDFIVKIPKSEWRIKNERRIIGKYNCIKATTTKEVENSKGIQKLNISAWFTNDIPLNYGPKEYSGLPGLILELKEGNVIYQMKSIKKIKYFNIKEPKKGKKITLSEFNKLGKEMYKNRYN